MPAYANSYLFNGRIAEFQPSGRPHNMLSDVYCKALLRTNIDLLVAPVESIGGYALFRVSKLARSIRRSTLDRRGRILILQKWGSSDCAIFELPGHSVPPQFDCQRVLDVQNGVFGGEWHGDLTIRHLPGSPCSLYVDGWQGWLRVEVVDIFGIWDAPTSDLITRTLRGTHLATNIIKERKLHGLTPIAIAPPVASRTAAITPPPLLAAELTWRLLPEGWWRDIEYLPPLPTRRESSPVALREEHERIRFLASLGPQAWYEGAHLDRRVYRVAVFPGIAIADTVSYGNALYYCLREGNNWMSIFRLTKRGALDAGASRIFHRKGGGWETRVRDILRRATRRPNTP